MHTTVERELEVSLVLSPERSTPVAAKLTYRTDDPFAVHMDFHLGTSSTVHWVFARELLTEGVFRPCGHGDVRVWPSRAGARTLLCLALSSPDGDVLLEAPAGPVSAWLERTMRAVPPGEEDGGPDLDAALTALLTAAADGPDE
jgi:hypothetical protein